MNRPYSRGTDYAAVKKISLVCKKIMIHHRTRGQGRPAGSPLRITCTAWILMTPVWAKRFFIPKSPRDVKTHSKPCPPSLFKSFFCSKPSLWPGSPAFGGIARKKHRWGKNSIRRSSLASAEWGGPLGRPAGRPYIGKPLFSEKERPALPVPC